MRLHQHEHHHNTTLSITATKSTSHYHQPPPNNNTHTCLAIITEALLYILPAQGGLTTRSSHQGWQGIYPESIASILSLIIRGIFTPGQLSIDHVPHQFFFGDVQ
jgi:hypothetical protein